MEILPSEYQQIELSRNEKIFVRNVMSSERFGYLLIKTNPAMLKNESMHTLVCSDGVIFFKFFEGFSDPSQFGFAIPMLIDTLYAQTVRTVSAKLLSNKALVCNTDKLRFPINLVYVFPELQRKDVAGTDNEKLKSFIDNACLFKEDLPKFRTEFETTVSRLLEISVIAVSEQRMEISDENVNSVLQRIAPEYVTIRVSAVTDEERKAGVDNELLVVTEDDALNRQVFQSGDHEPGQAVSDYLLQQQPLFPLYLVYRPGRTSSKERHLPDFPYALQKPAQQERVSHAEQRL